MVEKQCKICGAALPHSTECCPKCGTRFSLDSNPQKLKQNQKVEQKTFSGNDQQFEEMNRERIPDTILDSPNIKHSSNKINSSAKRIISVLLTYLSYPFYFVGGIGMAQVFININLGPDNMEGIVYPVTVAAFVLIILIGSLLHFLAKKLIE